MEIGRKKKGASIIFVNTSCQVLLLLRDDTKEIPFPNCWDVPGGRVEEGETPEECIHREMREELEIEIDHPRLFHVYDLDDRLEHTFWQHAELDIAALQLHEGQRVQWFSEDDIERLPGDQIAFNFKPVLRDFYRERPWARFT